METKEIGCLPLTKLCEPGTLCKQEYKSYRQLFTRLISSSFYAEIHGVKQASHWAYQISEITQINKTKLTLLECPQEIHDHTSIKQTG